MKVGILVLLSFFMPIASFASDEIIPQMKECMAAHGSQQEYSAVLQKYCDQGLMRKAMGLLIIRQPYVVKTEKEGSSICYTVEGVAVETSSEIPSDTTQTYRACWENDRIRSLEFYGPKQRPGEDIIPEMQECLKSHDSREKYQKVLGQYCDPGLIRRAMSLLIVKEPYVTRVDKAGPVIFYTVRGRLIESSSEIPADTVQIYRVGWKGGRIISLEFLRQERGLE